MGIGETGSVVPLSEPSPPPTWIALAFAAYFGAGAILAAITAGYIAAAPLVLGCLHCFDVSYGRRSSIVEVAQLLHNPARQP